MLNATGDSRKASPAQGHRLVMFNQSSSSNLPINILLSCKMSEAQESRLDIRSKSSWTSYLHEEVTAVWGDAVLIVGCFATGLLDSAVFNVWSCFVSMQTGEIVSTRP